MKVQTVSIPCKQVVLLLFLAFFIPSVAVAEQLWIDGNNESRIIPELNLPSFAPAIEKLGESVVNIQTEGREEGPKGAQQRQFRQGPGGEANPFDFFFRMPPEQKNRRFSSLGSGFVIHPDGYIVTNHHVVDKASKIIVSFRDEKKTYEATLIGSDPKTDLALIKVDYPKKLSAAPLGDSDVLAPGDWVIAIGNPFRLGHTATVGIVSAKHRRINAGKPYNYTNFIQTDASINPGNSGGPLFNANGEVIGVNTAIYSPGRMGQGGFNIGIGFAIPINMAKGIISQIKDTGKVTRGWLGVLIQPVTEEVAEALELDSATGALVAQVMDNSPASKAGFRPGDVILSFDGSDVEENDDLPMMVAETPVDKQVSVSVMRDGKRKKLKVVIKELQDQEVEEVEPVENEETTLGLTVQELTEEIARALSVEELNGVVVTAVEPESPAAEAMLRRGDIILEVGSEVVNSVKGFQKSIEAKISKGKPVLLLVRRNTNTLFFTIKPE